VLPSNLLRWLRASTLVQTCGRVPEERLYLQPWTVQVSTVLESFGLRALDLLLYLPRIAHQFPQ